MKSATRPRIKATAATSGPASRIMKKPPTTVAMSAAMKESLTCQLQTNKASPINQIMAMAMASARSFTEKA